MPNLEFGKEQNNFQAAINNYLGIIQKEYDEGRLTKQQLETRVSAMAAMYRRIQGKNFSMEALKDVFDKLERIKAKSDGAYLRAIEGVYNAVLNLMDTKNNLQRSANKTSSQVHSIGADVNKEIKRHNKDFDKHLVGALFAKPKSVQVATEEAMRPFVELDAVFANYQKHLDVTAKKVCQKMFIDMLENLANHPKAHLDPSAKKDIQNMIRQVKNITVDGRPLSAGRRRQRSEETLAQTMDRFTTICQGLTNGNKFYSSSMTGLTLPALKEHMKQQYAVYAPRDLKSKGDAVLEIRGVLNGDLPLDRRIKVVRDLCTKNSPILEEYRGNKLVGLLVKALNSVLKLFHEKPIIVTGAKVSRQAQSILATEAKSAQQRELKSDISSGAFKLTAPQAKKPVHNKFLKQIQEGGEKLLAKQKPQTHLFRNTDAFKHQIKSGAKKMEEKRKGLRK